MKSITKVRIYILLIIMLLTVNMSLSAVESEKTDPRLEWFVNAKLGIFIHWGIYAVNGIAESWSFFNGQISYDDYLKQLDGFTAEKYDPEEWAALFKKAGARYAVLTSKHHDGVALWDTKMSDLNVVKKTPAGRDLIAPYCEALRAEGLRVGLYFSHLDWSHPDYASVFNNGGVPGNPNPFAYPEKEDSAAWERFLKFHRGQIKEISDKFKPDLWWFDGDWERSSAQWRMPELRKNILAWQPRTIINGRMGEYGDYQTPEQGVPIVRPDCPWEFCMTINDSWGFQKHDNNHKSAARIIQIFSECLGLGGNLLLDVGPKADGSITKPQKERLLELGAWIKKHKEAVYPTVAGLPFGHFYGPTTLTKDRTTIYLYLFDIPKDKITLKGVRNKIKNIRVVGKNKELEFDRSGGASWLNIPGVLLIDVPKKLLDKYVTVLAVELDGPLDLYHGAGQAIESN